ncbi:MAG: hypothetical protein F9K18_00930 [Thermoanaerobaculia bacterium]|nr:MAG: hypothetical protein F9K18_00930 [Thermoanaerobaculia bacterium]
MRNGFFVRLKPALELIDVTMDGRALAGNESLLSPRCEELRVTPVLAFVSPDAETQRGALDSFGMYDVAVVPEHWHSPADGLRTFESLIELVEKEREWFRDPELLLEDLRRVKEILAQAESAGAEWNLDAEL